MSKVMVEEIIRDNVCDLCSTQGRSQIIEEIRKIGCVVEDLTEEGLGVYIFHVIDEDLCHFLVKATLKQVSFSDLGSLGDVEDGND